MIQMDFVVWAYHILIYAEFMVINDNKHVQSFLGRSCVCDLPSPSSVWYEQETAFQASGEIFRRAAATSP